MPAENPVKRESLVIEQAGRGLLARGSGDAGCSAALVRFCPASPRGCPWAWCMLQFGLASLRAGGSSGLMFVRQLAGECNI